MITIEAGTTIPSEYPYAGFVVTRVSRNGWCRGYYPANAATSSVKEAMTSVRAHWLVGVNTLFNLIPTPDLFC